MNLRGILDAASSGKCAAVLISFTGGYVLFSASGLLGPIQGGLFGAFHKSPAVAALTLLIANNLLRLVRLRRRPALATIFLFAGVVTTAAGFLVSGLTRFEGVTVANEGQELSGGEQFVEGSVYARKFSSKPEAAVRVKEVVPLFRAGGRGLWDVRSDVLLTGIRPDEDVTASLRLLFPKLVGGSFYRIKNFGYSPRYRIIVLRTAQVAEEAYVGLGLFPPGSEDYFRIMMLPHTFYVRYYPDSSLITDKAYMPRNNRSGPLFRLRVARNLDLVFDGYIAPGELAQVESYLVSFEDVRKWVEIKVVRDWGLFLILPGMMLVATALIWGWLIGYSPLGGYFADPSAG